MPLATDEYGPKPHGKG